MTFEAAMGVVAAVYNTPLPAVFDMALCSITAYAMMSSEVKQLTDPMAAPAEEPETMSADQLRRLLG